MRERQTFSGAGRAKAAACLWALAIALSVAAAPAARAAEGEGCAAASWSLEAARAKLNAPDLAPRASGTTLGGATEAFRLALAPADAAGLPTAPERKPKEGTFAGYVTLPAVPAGTRIEVTLTDAAWIDLVRDGAPIKSGPFTGVHNCPGARKSVRFDVPAQPAAAAPLVLQISGAPVSSIGIAVAPVQ